MDSVVDIIRSVPRVAIVGGPRTGKTTLAKRAAWPGRPGLPTDGLIKLGWSEASAQVAQWFDTPGPTLVEGVAVARGLRKWLVAHQHDAEKPVDVLVVLKGSKLDLSLQQENMRKGVHTVLYEIENELAKRGVQIVTVDG